MRAMPYYFSLLLALVPAAALGSAHMRRRVPSSGVETFYSAQDPSVWSVGRFQSNPDGSLSFDWENAQLHINVANASYVKVLVSASGGALGRFVADVNGWETASFFVGGHNSAAINSSSDFLVANDLYATRHIRVTSVLEPSFEGASEEAFLSFLGFKTDGVAVAPTPQARRIELVGDSISAGYGSRGFAGAPLGCPVNDITSGNRYTYNWQLAEALSADIVPVAWSGKGMYENCCDKGITMPSLYLQVFGGRPYSTDYDFAWVPDAMIINLGTNDFGHDAGPAWEANFTATYVQFVANATARYKAPKLPIFVAQGPMNNGAPLFNALQAAITGINAAGGNAIYLDMRGPPNDGCGGHPGVEGHKGMAAMALPVIQKAMGW